MQHPAFICAAAALASAATCRTLAAQMVLGFGGLEARGGIADAQAGGSSATFEVDLGYAVIPALRTTLGIDFFGANMDRVVSGDRVGGSMQGAGGVAALRYDAFARRRFGVHLVAGAAIHSIRTSPDDPSAKDSLGGRHGGLQFGAGISWHIGSGHFWSATADVRRVAERDVGRTLITVGLRYSIRGRRMYDRDEIPAVTPTPSSSALHVERTNSRSWFVAASSTHIVEPLAHGSSRGVRPFWGRPTLEAKRHAAGGRAAHVSSHVRPSRSLLWMMHNRSSSSSTTTSP